MLEFFCLIANCEFLGEITKVKTNIVYQYFEVTISIYKRYDIFHLFEMKYENVYI